MTLRLVALMSVVLLVSLAAFGLLLGHYQDEVMQEVAQTASAVGRATLETLELPALNSELEANEMMVWHSEVRSEESVTGDPPQRFVVIQAHGPGPTTVEHLVDEEGHTLRRVRTDWTVTSDEESGADPSRAERRIERRVLSSEAVASPGQPVRVVVDLEEIHAERLPAGGNLLLKIPTFAASGGASTWTPAPESAGPDSADVASLVPREIALPISMGDYDDLFRSLRGRSLMLFLAVFLVGTVLSAGVATRFTRPIRRLDAGIRRLSDGDLEARVDVEGHGEIARLSRAFNEMTTKLRAGRERERELVRREKLSALGGLAAGVAHDVRNPLHSIGLTLQHLSEACRPEDDDRGPGFDEGIEIIRGEIRRLDQLVTNFLRFARSERRQRQSVDLAVLLRETASLIRKEAEWRKVSVELDLLETAPAISADAEGLRSSILNLVLNGFQAMPEGGELRLGLGIAEDALVVEVADNGCGIPAAEQDRVFEFAYTTREGGSGLGLAMVQHSIVTEHGGRVSVESEPGCGTRVRLYLPLRAHVEDAVS